MPARCSPAIDSRAIRPPPLTNARGMAYHMLMGIARDARAFHATAHSLGEASAENKGHGPETSRDADGQDRWRRLKAQPPVAEGNTSTSRGAKARPGRGRPVVPPMRDPGDQMGKRPEPSRTACAPSHVGRGHVVFPGRHARQARRPGSERGNVWTLVRVPVPTFDSSSAGANRLLPPATAPITSISSSERRTAGQAPSAPA